VTAAVGPDLARITVATPKRRIDVALPENALVSELLPHLLRHAGDELADDGEKHGGWTLRRVTGDELDPVRTLAVQGVRDGEILNLVPRRLDWPELAYDDVVEIIAGGSRRTGRSWGAPATRRCALAVTAVILVVGLVEIVTAGPSWAIPAGCALAIAAVLTLLGVVLSRALSDAVAGGVLAACALPYAFVGGLFVALPRVAGVSQVRAPDVLLGSAALVVFATIGYAAVAATVRIFIAGISAGVAGLIAGLLCLAGMHTAGAAGITLTIALGLLPGYPLISSWLGKLPVPALPDRPEDILADQPVPPREGVFAAVTRATELLTGLLLGAAVISVVSAAVVTMSDSTSGKILAGVAAAAILLRGRLFPAARQRVPLMSGGIAILVLLVFSITTHASGAGARLLILVALVIVAGLVLAGGLVYTKRSPSPYIGRLADIVDVLAIMALVPLACAVAGVFHIIQGLFASVG